MQHRETHSHSRGASRKALAVALALTTGYMAIEVVGGLAAGSLALLADAGHMLTDAFSIGLALAAVWMASRAVSARHTFGLFRAEVLSALVNGIGLWAVAGWIFFEAYRRLQAPLAVEAPLMLIVGGVGLIVNVAVALVLRRTAGESLNVEGAFLHVVVDLIGSIGVLLAGGLIALFDWTAADPILSVGIGLLVLVSATRLLRKVLVVLMQGTPIELDLARLCTRLEGVDGVTGVHDIHAWTLTSGYHILSAHVTTGGLPVDLKQRVLRDLRQIATDTGISHATFQLEDTAEECEEEVHHTPHNISI